MVGLLLLLGCPSEDGVFSGESPEMDPVAALVRTSMDLRGVRPSAEEVARVEADAGELDVLVDEFLADPRFEGRVRDLWSEIYLTRTETLPLSAASYGLDDQATFERSVGDEPLRILGRIAAEDRPYTELVTGDWTMADEMLETIWPVEREAGDGWQIARYTDGRPAAGVMATNSLWWRYTSTSSNANRKRANAVSRILLCNDYLVRPIEFDRNVNLLDEGAVSDAVKNNAACVNCHDSLDPIASYFFGFWWYDFTPIDNSYYHPDRELLYRDYTGVDPAWYGDPGYTLADLGGQIARDLRFPQCAATQAFELLLRRDATTADADAVLRHRDAFITGGLTIRALVRSVVSDPMYRAGATDEPGYVPLKMVTPDLLASTVEELTGFRWTYADFDMLQTDRYGYRTLAGGADGYSVTSTATGANATLVLVQERLAEAAASWVVENEPSRLFTVDFTETPETAREAMAAQVQALHLRLFGHRVEADGEEVAAALELWNELYAIERDPRQAWAGLLTALLRDPDFLYY